MTATVLPLHPQLANDGRTVYARPYDVLSRSQAQHHLDAYPNSIVQVTRPDILSVNTAASEYQCAANKLNQLKVNCYQPHHKPCLIRYQIDGPHSQQTGLMCMVDTHQIGVHEVTRQDKVDDRFALGHALRCQVSPVMLFAKASSPLSDWLSAANPIDNAWQTTVEDHGYQHQLNLVDDDELLASVVEDCQSLPTLYLADGHHRCATQMALSTDHPRQHHPYVLAVVFPASSLNILGYHRIVRRPPRLTTTEILGFIDHLFDRTVVEQPVLPNARGEFGMRVDHQWYHLTLRQSPKHQNLLDAAILQNQIIAPLLGVVELRADPNIEFIGGTNALETIEARTRPAPLDWVSFTLFPPSVDDIITTTDHKGIMPPKSTYFEPKLLDGLVLQDDRLIRP